MRAAEPAASTTGAGLWWSGPEPPAFAPAEVRAATERCRETAHVVREPRTGHVGVAFGGAVSASPADRAWPLLGSLPPLYPEWLGDRGFGEVHHVRFPYIAGEMANGIATPRLVVAMARAGGLGFFGAAGLAPAEVERGLQEIQAQLTRGESWGSNLIHSLNEPELESAIVDLYLRAGVARVSASAFMGLTPAVVWYAARGLRADGHGVVTRAHHLFAKVSRPEVARHFMSPAPAALLDGLVASGRLTRDEASLARRIPLAEDVTAEADSGGHTDNRPLAALVPTLLRLRDEIASRNRFPRPVRVGAAGGLGTPSSVAAAFALGAAYVLTGTVNQAAVESGQSDEAKAMLAQAELADVMMAPAGDMFEAGVKVQVLRRGCLFGPRAALLYSLYQAYDGLEHLPADIRARLEKELFLRTLDAVWSETRAYFEKRDPEQLRRAERDTKQRMALVFRWYLGLSSRWAIAGDKTRRLDYQIWCGPAMGAFNAWVRGSPLESLAGRTVAQIALNLLEGAAAISRAQQLRTYGVPVPAEAFDYRPRLLR
jgi:trans-AT polyketide synthase/acyltransferase/oxidoreductase domain-containing protein